MDRVYPLLRVRRRRCIAALLLAATPSVFGLAGCGVLSRPALPDESRSSRLPSELAGVIAGAAARPTPAATPAVPTATDLVQQTLGHHDLPPGGWTVGGIVLGFRAVAPSGQTLIPQVEVVPVDSPFRETPTISGKPVAAVDGLIDARVTLPSLAPGEYRWQARFADGRRDLVGAWRAYGDGRRAFGVVGRAPSIRRVAVADAIESPRGVAMVGQQGSLTLHPGVAAEPPEAFDHLAFRRDATPRATTAVPADAKVVKTGLGSLSLSGLPDGTWYVHLWAVDRAGQVSKPATIPIVVQREPARIDDVIYRKWATNPRYQIVPIRFMVSHPATVDLSIFGGNASAPLRTYHLGRQQPRHEVMVEWDGKDAQQRVVAPGTYHLRIVAVDDAGTRTEARFAGLTITDKSIRVSLKDQSLTAYLGGQAVLKTLVTTGGAELPTRPGQFEIETKESPFTFHSPWPRGSRFWYPDETVRYAMLFNPTDGDFIHSGPRYVYGPGSNGRGTPGGPYTGSHGCVNVPIGPMSTLFNWTPLGTPVIVAP